MTPARWAAFAAGTLVAALLLFFVFAQPRLDAPWSVTRTLDAMTTGWESSNATLAEEGGALVLRGADASGASTAMRAVDAFDAGTFRHLRYSLDLARHDKALFLWRSGGAWRNVALPGASGTLDLAKVDTWNGSVEAIGVAVFPTDYLSGRASAEREARLHALALDEDSQHGALAWLWTQWTAYRPWNGRSNHTGGFELATGIGASLALFIALCTAAGLGVLALIAGRRAARCALVPAVVAGAALLATWQLAQLWQRRAVAHDAAHLATAEQPLAAQPQLGEAARKLSERLQQEPGRPRVFVAGEGLFLSEYPTWLLREHNAVTLADRAALPARLDEPAFLVAVGPGPWEFDVASGRFTLEGRPWRGELVFDGGVMRAWRISTWQ